MNDKPERIWATGNYETGSWNAIEGRMKSHMPDGWQTEYVRATDYDALAAKLAEVVAERDAAMRAVDENWITHQRVVAAEAALPAVYRLGLGDAVNTLRTKQNHLYTTRCDEFVQTRTRDALEMADMIEASPTPTAAELMARIQTGENQ